ncbi:hypothetical protein JOY44_04540 [Phormidium sp. CLA17]|uniref:hypothetical protein n=1 Tax=Leptolyngbya sp. Cla-17 TaxID=2803751 RepID=UPI00149292D4|nr:hypothetical protein [Leptolyngbya sp. Cla-17]MBM0740890.1 hypothetical protein [Leptolyngbya sp. Cla-17]
MTVESTFTVPEKVTFEQAIALSQALVDQMAQGTIADSSLEQAIAELVASENGARGFFVTYLSDERPIADPPSTSVITALKTAPAVVAPLIVKNLAMSTATAIAHRRNQNEALAQGSDRVKVRSTYILQAIQSDETNAQIQALMTSINTQAGDYSAFLKRWGYDSEQQQAIQQAFESL